MANGTNVNYAQLLMAMNQGIDEALMAQQLIKSNAVALHIVDSLGDTNQVFTFGVPSDAAFVNRREATFTVHTIGADAAVSVTAYGLSGVVTIPYKQMEQANNPIAKALASVGAAGLTESIIAGQLAERLVIKYIELVIHQLVTVATSSSMVYDMTGETPPANKITASTRLAFLNAMKLKYSPGDAPPASAFLSSLELKTDWANIQNPNTAEAIYANGAGDQVVINEVPLLGYSRTDADNGVITGCKGTISDDSAAKYRFLRLEPECAHLFVTGTPEALDRGVRVMEVGNSETSGKGPGVQISYSLELACYVPAKMHMRNKPGVSMGLAGR